MAMRYPGGFISSTAPTVNANTAKGVWTLEEAMQYIRAGQWPVPTGNGDPYFQYNTMLLPGQGTTGAQNNTFLDSSTNNFTINRSGNTTQGTFTPFSGANGNWSNYLGGSQNIYAASNAAFGFGTGDFTVEFWMYLTVAPSSGSKYTLVDFRPTATATPHTIYILNSSGTLYLGFYNGTSDITSSAQPLSTNSWNHCAYSRSGGQLRIYVNGLEAYSAANTIDYQSTRTLTIGSSVAVTEGMQGYLSNFRITKGGGLYTSAFTPSTSPLTTTVSSGTVTLLTCQSNRFVDNSASPISLSVTSTPSVTPFQPFGAPTSAYSASTIGGSGYFDGSGDYLTATANNAFNFGTGDFTVEGWFYPLAVDKGIWTNGPTSSGSFGIAINSSGKLQMDYYGGTSLAGATTVNLNSWNYFAFVRSGSTLSIYLNGVRDATTTTSSNNSTNDFALGRSWTNLGSNEFNGYIAGFRISDAYARYSGTTMTVPTAPTVNDGNTTVLCNFTNAGIIDNAQDNNLETVGGAQISTTQYKWGASSMYFDGTGDWVLAPSSQNIAMGTGDFTIEFWMYLTGVSGEGTTVYNSTSGGINLFMSISSNWGIARSGVGVDNNFGTPPAQNQWNHIVVNRTASVIKAFINGNQVFAGANTSNYVAGPIQIGGSSFGTITGYIQDLRITKGYARYPYNFTAPTAALPLFWQAAATPSSDPYFDYTTLLLPGNGTNGAQNNSFLDSSGNGNNPSRSGNVTQGTFTPFSQTGWGNFFDGNGDYLNLSSNAAFAFGTGDFTFETFAYYNALSPADSAAILNWSGATWAANQWSLHFNHSSAPNKVTFWFYNYSSSVPMLTGSTTMTVGQWYHIAVTRNGNVFKLFINGVAEATVTSSASIDGNTNSPIYLGGGLTAGNTQWFNGYMSNVRLVKGTAVYTSAFTVPTSPLTAVSGTSLLTCQSNRFIDNSTNAFTITRNGDTSVQAFSPFNPTAAYSTSTVGGSGYSDGSGDYLTVASNANLTLGSSDFTIELWWYPLAFNSDSEILTMASSGGTNRCYAIYSNASNGTLLAFAGTGSTSWDIVSALSMGTAIKNAWNHIAFTRSGSTFSTYLNGTRIATTTATGTLGSSGLGILANNSGTSQAPNSYISGVRTIKGTALYTGTTYTVPTEPPTAITNTNFLANFTNGGITDATAKNDLETVGGASISTTVSKFGGSSMYFDGSGDYLDVLAANQLNNFSSGDWTIEAWIYRSTASANHCILNFINSAGANAGLTLQVNSSNQLVTDNGSAGALAAGTVPSNQWVHIAIARYSGTTTGYINGFAVGTTTQAPSASQYLRIGALGNGAYAYHGYINDLRVTKGIARYTTNFTPPTTAFLTL